MPAPMAFRYVILRRQYVLALVRDCCRGEGRTVRLHDSRPAAHGSQGAMKCRTRREPSLYLDRAVVDFLAPWRPHRSPNLDSRRAGKFPK
jgi:hypothetical protein